MTLPTIEFYSDPHCPWAYLAVWRLHSIWPDYAGRLQVAWRSLSLEFINERGTPKPVLDVEVELLQRIEPQLPLQRWSRPDWEWPVTFWPACEALHCAQAQGEAAGFAMSWALRYAFFAESRSPALRHEIAAVARQVAADGPLDLERFMHDWDSGRFKASVLQESQRGWHELKLPGSPTMILPGGRVVHNLAAGEADIDEQHGTLRSYTPPQADPLTSYRQLLDEVLQAAAAQPRH